jgi:sugar/nucleoside kinase (ribokinase family)
MAISNHSVVVAGHICLDLIPGLDHLAGADFSALFQPGHLVTAGPATFCTGGPVSNTGLALFRLGIPTRLIAKVGADPFGQIVRGMVEGFDPALTEGIVEDAAAVTSYTVIVSPPGMDRIFLHCPGANDTFCTADIDLSLVQQADLFHFGYPPIMRRMYENGGAELVEVLRQARSTGATTSLDMAYPDPSSESGRADWRSILQAALPYVDLFLPSLEEILYMLQNETFLRMQREAPGGQVLKLVEPELLSALSRELIEMGARIVVIKLGDRGLYLRTSGLEQLQDMGRAAPVAPQAWANQELWAPCFQVQVVGTTGSGDATIAGFLSAMLRGFSPHDAVTAAAAVGACNVEAADALSGIRSWKETLARIESGWPRLPLQISHPKWHKTGQPELWVGPASSFTE